MYGRSPHREGDAGSESKYRESPPHRPGIARSLLKFTPLKRRAWVLHSEGHFTNLPTEVQELVLQHGDLTHKDFSSVSQVSRGLRNVGQIALFQDYDLISDSAAEKWRERFAGNGPERYVRKLRVIPTSYFMEYRDKPPSSVKPQEIFNIVAALLSARPTRMRELEIRGSSSVSELNERVDDHHHYFVPKRQPNVISKIKSLTLESICSECLELVMSSALAVEHLDIANVQGNMENCPRLTELKTLTVSDVTEAMLTKLLERGPQITALSIHDFPQFIPLGAIQLVNLTKLEAGDCSFSLIQHITQVVASNLKDLHITDTTHDQGFQASSSPPLPNLRNLYLGLMTEAEAVECLKWSANIETLELDSRCELKESYDLSLHGLQKLQKLTALDYPLGEVSSLINTSLTVEDFTYRAVLDTLSEDPRDLRIGECYSLTKLTLIDCSMLVVNAFLARFPNLAELVLSGIIYNDELKISFHRNDLKTLCLGWNVHESNIDRALLPSPDYFQNLRDLEFLELATFGARGLSLEYWDELMFPMLRRFGRRWPEMKRMRCRTGAHPTMVEEMTEDSPIPSRNKTEWVVL